MTGLFAWAQFLACIAVIAALGPTMVRSGEAIARRTGMSLTWVGLILLATATSLPELFTGISAVTLASAPDIAMGDALGSCVFNLVMLVVLDSLSREEPVWRRIDQGHILSAGYGVILIGFVGALIVVARGEMDFRIGHVSVFSPLLIVLYFVAVRSAFFYERRVSIGRDGPPAIAGDPTLRRAVAMYVFSAIVVAAIGIWLPLVGVQVAEAMGLNESFVGTLLIGGATSIPELLITVAALRIGAPDLAIGNLLGSNLFAILVIGIDDFFYVDGSFVAAVSPSHAITSFAGSIMAGIVIVALLYRPGNRFFGIVGWIGLSLLSVYLLSSYAIYLHGH